MKLKERGIDVSEPASNADLLELKTLTSPEVFDALYCSIYRWFDGFANDDFDQESFLRLWPIERVLASDKLCNGFVPFLDFSLDSEIYGLVDGHVPNIFAFHSKTTVSVDLYNLIPGIIEGRFDFTLGL